MSIFEEVWVNFIIKQIEKWSEVQSLPHSLLLYMFISVTESAISLDSFLTLH